VLMVMEAFASIKFNHFELGSSSFLAYMVHLYFMIPKQNAKALISLTHSKPIM